ncbi:MAG: TldD/PmbA family protein [Pseudomonadota bacterium]
MNRRDFIRLTGLGLTAVTVPVIGRPLDEGGGEPIAVAIKRQLADAALATAREAGASYADVRVGRYLRQFIITREKTIQNIVNTTSEGTGIRVLVEGTWGFAATNDLDADAVRAATRQAVAIARANAKLQARPVELAPVRGAGEVTWATPIRRNAFDVPISEKADLLLSANAAAVEAGATFASSNMFQVNEQKYFASTDGSYIDQDVHRIWAPFNVTAIDRGKGGFRSRQAIGVPMGMGYEYLEPDPAERVDGVTPRYRYAYDIIEDARNAGRQAREKLTAKSVEPGRYDLVLDPTHLMLTIHESVGHPLELDRVLGYEANYAGTSFATLDKWRSGDFQYGSDIVTLFADKVQPHSLGHVAYDDEGVKTKRWDLVKDGILVNYQGIRDQVHVIDQDESHGCCYADSWDSIQFQRMPNVSLEPGTQPLSVDQMISDVEKGIYIVGRGSYSIDQQRYNMQYGGQLFYEIKDGEIVGMLEDVTYQSTSTEFWNACAAICDESDYRLGGTFFDGKGEPSQVSAVSHGCSTARFNGMSVINSARKI